MEGAEELRRERIREVGLAFRCAYHSLRRLRARETQLVGGEPGNAHYELMARLDEEGPLPAGALAEKLNVKPATISQMVDVLEQGGFVERTRSEADRRVVAIGLTRRGRPWIAKRRAEWAERWATALADFDEAELATAIAVLERIRETVDEAHGA